MEEFNNGLELLANCEYLTYAHKNLYPFVNPAMSRLIDHLLESDEVQKYQHKLKIKKVFDKAEQRKIEKERLREELGSQYYSSESDEEFMENPSDHSIQEESPPKRKEKKKSSIPNPSLYEEINEKMPELEQKPSLRKRGSMLDDLKLMQKSNELDEKEEEDDQSDESTIRRQKNQEIKRLKELRADYNPLRHFAHLLREIKDEK